MVHGSGFSFCWIRRSSSPLSLLPSFYRSQPLMTYLIVSSCIVDGAQRNVVFPHYGSLAVSLVDIGVGNELFRKVRLSLSF